MVSIKLVTNHNLESWLFSRLLRQWSYQLKGTQEKRPSNKWYVDYKRLFQVQHTGTSCGIFRWWEQKHGYSWGSWTRCNENNFLSRLCYKLVCYLHTKIVRNSNITWSLSSKQSCLLFRILLFWQFRSSLKNRISWSQWKRNRINSNDKISPWWIDDNKSSVSCNTDKSSHCQSCQLTFETNKELMNSDQCSSSTRGRRYILESTAMEFMDIIYYLSSHWSNGR